MITNELDTKKTGTAPSCHAPEDTAYRWEPWTGHFGLSSLVLIWPGPEKHVQLAHLWPPADMICLLAILDMVHHNDICKNPWNFTIFYLHYFVVVTIPPCFMVLQNDAITVFAQIRTYAGNKLQKHPICYCITCWAPLFYPIPIFDVYISI